MKSKTVEFFMALDPRPVSVTDQGRWNEAESFKEMRKNGKVLGGIFGNLD